MDKARASHRDVVIIGAGVIGLTCALSVQSRLAKERSEHSYRVILVSQDFPTSTPGAPSSHDVSYASMWAGAHVRPIPASTPQLIQEAGWLKITGKRFESLLQREPWLGITQLKGVEYLEAPDEAYQLWNKDVFEQETGLRGFREIPADDLPSEVQLGFEYTTYCINAPLYCTGLLRKFILGGGKTVKRRLASEWEGFSLSGNVAIVVNASGTGFGDPKSFPTRGQIVLTNLSDVSQTITRQNKDGSWSFVIPRFYSGGTIIGGTKEPHNWAVEPVSRTRKSLLTAARQLCPDLATSLESLDSGNKGFEVIADVVGRRPTHEGGMRIQVEKRVENGTKLAGEPRNGVVHAYGAGGRGFEISWGVAEEVTELVFKELLSPPSSLRSKL